jgi:phosphate starvation-inducible protein PhoH and related proteins
MPRKKPSADNNQTLNTNPFKSKISIRGKNLTDKQKKFLKLGLDPDTKIIFVDGPAGSTKTYVSVFSALRELQKNDDLDLLYVRTAIESADKGLGALPGTLEEKFNPYMAPLEDKLDELLPPTTPIAQEMIQSGRIQAMPINFLRGANWINKIIIADESQNFTFKELVTLITRIGKNSKLIICGDMMQSDINGKSGFFKMINLFNDEDSRNRGIHCFRFTEEDILRSEILKYIVQKLKSTQS